MNERYIPHQITPHLWHIQECLDNPGYMSLIVGEKKALLFDTGYGSGDLSAVVKNITDLPLEVVLSHGHFDHACAAWQFDSAWIHPADLNFCLESTSRKARASHWGVNTRHRDAPADIPGFRPFYSYINDGCCPLKPLSQNQVFDLGGITARVVETPGHTLGSIGLLLEEERIFLAEDCANPTFFLFVEHSGTLENHKNNLKQLLNMPFDTFFIGHRLTRFPKKKLEDFLKAAEQADPAKDRIHVMTRVLPSPVYRSQYGEDEDPESCYMLYRRDQVSSSETKLWEGVNVVVFPADTKEGIQKVKNCLSEQKRVFAWVGKKVPVSLRLLKQEYGSLLQILEEVNQNDPELIFCAAQITGDMCQKPIDAIYGNIPELPFNIKQLF